LRLRQILINLVGNAVKFTPTGSVTIDVRLSFQDTCRSTLRFTVTDTGIGIPENKFQELFSAFTQVDASTTRQYGGTGLGLAISKQLVSLMGGEIGVENNAEGGATFWFTAVFEKRGDLDPVCLERTKEIARPELMVPWRGERSAEILIVEDSATNREVILVVLDKLGFSADTAANGIEGLTALAAKRYDLVFMDCQMPEMDGYEMTRRIRSETAGFRNRRVPIVAMTAHAMRGDRQRCLDAGMDDYIPKPISISSVASALRRWLNGEDRQRVESPESYLYRPPSSPSVKVFDRDALLGRLMGDNNLYQRVISGFLADVPEMIKALKECVLGNDADSTAACAHKIKGAAANVGGDALVEVLLEGEAAAKKGDLDRLRHLIGDVETRFERLKAEMAVDIHGI
jgi:CheY-like chemotaxis protein/HPt (histidine-containing phosphotransfer) domain-containing protein